MSDQLNDPLQADGDAAQLPSLAGTDAAGELPSLSQSARKKELSTARNILLAVGVLTIILNAAFLSQVEEQVDTEIQNMRMRGEIPGNTDPAKVQEFRDQVVKISKLINGGAAALGAVFVVLGLAVKSFPLPATILGLVLYIGSIAIFGVLNPATLIKGIIFKIIVVVCLFKSVQSAVAHQKQQRESDSGPVAMDAGLSQ
jgi:ABC-type siderophore export system fused ATPase/permease subunit